MNKIKKVLRKLLFPPAALGIPLVIGAAGLLIYAFTREHVSPAVEYASYALSFYALVIACLAVPTMIGAWKRFRQENILVRRYREDIHLRTKISLYGAILMNLAYALFQLFLGVYHASVWFYAFAAYYSLLAGMRLMLAAETKRGAPGENRLREWKRYRLCGVLLLGMNLTLGVIVGYIVWQGRTFRHHEITTIAMAAYTFTSMTLAIVNLVKYRKYNSPVLSASKAISLAAASVSMLTLETAMLTVFGGDDSPIFRTAMTAASGSAVCLFVLVMAGFMIVRSTKELKENRNGE